jgi:hypothetical protein
MADTAGNASFEEPIETSDGIRLNTFARRNTGSARVPQAAPQKSLKGNDLSSPDPAGVRSLNVRFRSCVNANEAYRACATETKAVSFKEANPAIPKPRKANGRTESAPRKSSGS